MSCLEFEVLSAYLDDEADSHEHDAMEAHLFVCESCRDRYRAARSLRGHMSVDPPARVLPRRLEISLTNLTDQFIDPVTDVGSTRSDLYDAHAKIWLRALIAASIAAVTVLGMGLFALRSGSVPTLSMVDHRVTGLSNLGHAALYEHMERGESDERQVIPLRRRHELERELRTELDFEVTIPKTLLGEPRGAGIVELDDEPVAAVDYEFNRVPVTLFALPRSIAEEHMNLRVDAGPDVCTMQEVRRCFTDGVGTSVCITSDQDMVWIWVGHLPKISLEKLIPYPL